MTEPRPTPDEPLQVVAVEELEDGELLVTVDPPDDDQLRASAGTIDGRPVTGLIGHPGLPDDEDEQS